MPKNIFFDVDGVLIHGHHHNPKYRNPWYTNIETDLGITQDQLQSLFVDGYMDQVFIGKKNLQDGFKEFLLDYGLLSRTTADEFINYWFSGDTTRRESVFDLVSELREISEYRVFIATAQAHQRADYIWNDMGFGQYFGDIFYTADLGIQKENSDFFNIIADRLSVQSTECYLIDDTPAVIRAADLAGWHTFHFDPPTRDNLASFHRLIRW
jgi:putative hydrolase of the HAD superfamily